MSHFDIQLFFFSVFNPLPSKKTVSESSLDLLSIPMGYPNANTSFPPAWCAQYSKQTDDRYSLGRVAKVISVEIRLILVIFVHWAVVVGGCCVCRRYVLVAVCGWRVHSDALVIPCS